MKFTEILNIISDENNQFWNWIESIRYDDAPDIYMVEFTAYENEDEDEDKEYFKFNVTLCDGGEVTFGIAEAEYITYIPIAVAKLISNIADRWEHYWSEENDYD